jgi:signal transduction histidine kinase
MQQRHEAPVEEQAPGTAWVASALVGAGCCAWKWDAASGAVEFFGAPAALLGSTPASLAQLDAAVREDDRAGRRAALDRARARGGSWVASFRLAAARERWLEERGTVSLDPAGRPVSAVALLADMTSRCGAEEVLHKRLDLAQMVSHDLRAPLGVVLGHARMLGRRAETPAALRNRAEVITTSALRMASMLDDLVESALLEAGKLQLELAPVDVLGLVRELCGRHTDGDGERVRVAETGLLPKVMGDANRLERVFTNLLTNAFKYSAPGTEITVRVTVRSPWVAVEFQDLGPGIAAEDVPHLFERYFRARSSGHVGGSGLGLYAAHRLVEAHGGTIEASSEPGKGSVFCVLLPVNGPSR